MDPPSEINAPRECGIWTIGLELALVENLQREDLNAVEAARGYQRLNKEFALSQEDIARRYGYALRTHKHELYGVCPSCQQKKS